MCPKHPTCTWQRWDQNLDHVTLRQVRPCLSVRNADVQSRLYRLASCWERVGSGKENNSGNTMSSQNDPDQHTWPVKSWLASLPDNTMHPVSFWIILLRMYNHQTAGPTTGVPTKSRGYEVSHIHLWHRECDGGITGFILYDVWRLQKEACDLAQAISQPWQIADLREPCGSAPTVGHETSLGSKKVWWGREEETSESWRQRSDESQVPDKSGRNLYRGTFNPCGSVELKPSLAMSIEDWLQGERKGSDFDQNTRQKREDCGDTGKQHCCVTGDSQRNKLENNAHKTTECYKGIRVRYLISNKLS